MKTTLSLGGIGPKLALLCLPYVILSLAVMYKYPDFLDLKFLDLFIVKMFGYIWFGLGLIYWLSSAIFFLKYFKGGKLITQGPFALCRNPIYSSMIVFIIPSFAIIFHSGLIFSISLVLYIGFKISIHGETNLLRRTFGEEYEKYENSVNELVPFPRRHYFSKNIKQ
jgi:protein-S-isoprenylcysteine O-methyltransferase Ste14